MYTSTMQRFLSAQGSASHAAYSISIGVESFEWRVTLSEPSLRSWHWPLLPSDQIWWVSSSSSCIHNTLLIILTSIPLLWLKASPEAALSELPSFVNFNSARYPSTRSCNMSMGVRQGVDLRGLTGRELSWNIQLQAHGERHRSSIPLMILETSSLWNCILQIRV